LRRPRAPWPPAVMSSPDLPADLRHGARVPCSAPAPGQLRNRRPGRGAGRRHPLFTWRNVSST
jgi:hypothetical protein